MTIMMLIMEIGDMCILQMSVKLANIKKLISLTEILSVPDLEYNVHLKNFF